MARRLRVISSVGRNGGVVCCQPIQLSPSGIPRGGREARGVLETHAPWISVGSFVFYVGEPNPPNFSRLDFCFPVSLRPQNDSSDLSPQGVWTLKAPPQRRAFQGRRLSCFGADGRFSQLLFL